MIGGNVSWAWPDGQAEKVGDMFARMVFYAARNNGGDSVSENGRQENNLERKNDEEKNTSGK
jgi:hypothetical protein